MNQPQLFPAVRPAVVLALVSASILLVASAERLSLLSTLRHVLTNHGTAALADGSAPSGWLNQFWPLQLSSREEISSGANAAQAGRLPPFAHLHEETVLERRIDPETLEQVAVPVRRMWVEHPFGYLEHVADKMAETVEIAVWGTVLAVLIALPLCVAAAAPMQSPAAVRAAARAVCAGLRAVPELISALFLVAALGFGALPGILALGAHSAGFLGRFYADAMEDADQRPVDALRASGAGWLATLRHAVLPQVRGPAVSATLYIFDRNVRMATVIGVVGAGGIGQELKGRMDTFEYHHVATILAAILLVVLAIDHLATRLRKGRAI